ncbi:hypothetical protein STCU_09595 [Strigomonas culicis]|uniref:EGF-like domain-containing protein n=1 Tax=Strigomonas culicis TaxID=28005 RepID=S9TRP9_9TRYP|nr:hypothetical protein STCU_09595 [Strigomonas culicis]|eukprot:EPY19153.1 hypothetical protein STCU_09595 [Strigomonas culicis]
MRSLLLTYILTWILVCALFTTVPQIGGASTITYVSDKSLSYSAYAFDDYTFNFDSLPFEPSKLVAVKLTDSSVSGDGLFFTRKGSYTDTTVAVLNLTLLGTTVTNAPVTFEGDYTNLNLLISGTTATMQGSTNLFVANNFIHAYNCVIHIQHTTVTWDADGAGGSVFAKVDWRLLPLRETSSFHMTWTEATNAASIFYAVVSASSREGSISGAGIMAIDFTVCTNCKKAFIDSENGVTSVAGPMDSSFRVSNATMTGRAVFWRWSYIQLLTHSYWATIVLSGITTDGPLFRSGVYGTLHKYSAMTMVHINAMSVGLLSSDRLFPHHTGSIPYCDIFMGNITIGGVKLPAKISTYRSYKLNPTVLIDDFSFATTNSGSGMHTYPIGAPTPAYCHWNCYRSTSTETLGPPNAQWKRAQCDCWTQYFKPYCSPLYDPIQYYAGYMYDASACNVAHCHTCQWPSGDVCAKCDTGYVLDGPGCSLSCKVDHCTTCVSNTKDECAVCEGNYRLASDKKSCTAMTCNVAHCDICVTEKDSMCQKCSAGYRLESNGTCTKVCQVGNCSKCVHDTEDKCEVCDGNYKRGEDNVSCEAMPCKAANCDTCVTEKDSVCQKCSAGYRLESNGTCTAKVCQVGNCAQCAHDTEDTCESCTSGYTATDSECVAASSSNGLSNGTLMGIAVGVSISAVIVALALLFFFCCWRRKERGLHSTESGRAELQGIAHKADMQSNEGHEWCSSTELESNAGEMMYYNPLLLPPTGKNGEITATESVSNVLHVRRHIDCNTSEAPVLHEEGPIRVLGD